MSNQLHSETKKDIDLVSYTQTDQTLLPANDIDDQIMPMLLLHFAKSHRLAQKVRAEIEEEVEEILKDLIEVTDMFKRLKSMEQLFNEQLKALLRPHVDGINKLKSKLLEEGKSMSRDQIEEAPKGTRSSRLSKLKEDAERLHVVGHQIAGEDIDAAEEIAKQLPDIRLNVSMLKETLQFVPETTLEFVPKVPSSGRDVVESTRSLDTADEADQAGETADASIRFVESPDKVIFGIVQDCLPSNEIQLFYQSLDSGRLKFYLLSLCVFPGNSIIKKRAIINWWVGELVDEFDIDIIEKFKEADNFFSRLLTQGIIEPVRSKQKPVVKRCRMHPFTRHMLIALAQTQEFLEVDSSGEILVESFLKYKRAFLVKTEKGSSQYLIRNNSNLKEMHTMFNISETFIDIQNHWFSKVKNLKVLQLGRWQASKEHHIEVASKEFLRQLSNLKYLRYLSLQGISMVSELPVSFSNLVNLRILDLKACHDLRELPSGLGRLKNLTVLDMSECYFLSHMPKELALLSQLQVLKGFLVCDPAEGNHCRLADLENLQHKLKKLSIYADGGDAKHDNIETELYFLKKFTALQSLSIAWVGAPSSMPKKNDRLMKRLLTRTFSKQKYSASRNHVNALRNQARMIRSQSSNLNLEKLDLLCTPWETIPDWLNPQENSNLMKLYIRGGDLRDIRCQNSSFSAVKILRLKHLVALEMDWIELKAAFPGLNYLEKVNCPKLSFFPCDNTGVWMRSSNSIATI